MPLHKSGDWELSVIQLAGVIIVFLGTLLLIFNERAAEEYSGAWGGRLKHAVAIGRFISICSGIFLVLIGFLMLFVKRS